MNLSIKIINLMNNYAPLKWRTVVQTVQKANLQTEKLEKHRQKIRKRKYFTQLDQEVQRHQKQQIRRSNEKSKDRFNLEKQIQRQKGQKDEAQRKRLDQQKRYRTQNYYLSTNKSRMSNKEAEQYPENPFVKLVDGMEERKRQLKKILMAQNQVNQYQSKIKMQDQKFKKNQQYLQKSSFENFVQDIYNKKIRDRDNFERKYLKITDPEKGAFKDLKFGENNSIQQQYVSYLKQQVKSKKIKENDNDTVDKKLMNIQKNANISDSSPAYLGRNVLNYDRSKQLSYIQKDLGLKSIPKIIPLSPDLDYKNYTHQLTSLQKYYQGRTNLMKVQLNNRSQQEAHESSNNLYQKKGYSIDQLKPNPGIKQFKISQPRQFTNPDAARRIKSEYSEPKPQIFFKSYDVITGLKKMIYI